MLSDLIHTIALIGLIAIVFIVSWSIGYNQGRQDQKMLVVRLRKQIDARSQS